VENYEKKTEQLVTWLRFDPDTSGIQVYTNLLSKECKSFTWTEF